MKRHRSYARRNPEIVKGIAETTAERARLNGELLQGLAAAAATHEKTELRFRTVVLRRLATIETLVKMIHGGQIATRPWESGLQEKIEYHARAAQEYVERESEELGLAMVKYVYAERGEQSPGRGKRRSGRARGN